MKKWKKVEGKDRDKDKEQGQGEWLMVARVVLREEKYRINYVVPLRSLFSRDKKNNVVFC